jgi:hypothetical protein
LKSQALDILSASQGGLAAVDSSLAPMLMGKATNKYKLSIDCHLQTIGEMGNS